ncbi:MAG: helix-turn-helix transcriptional regulator [Bacilli bacterium]|nr:helix-turn-helix transcriptional regulator [Bacilli bacterium]MBQ3511798.1 helix-turn-helix transcriptional regulator [Bacilli bacterium]
MKNNYMILAQRIKNRRIELGYSLRYLANEVGISHTELVRIENGNRQCLNVITLIRICKLLNLDFLLLLEEANFYEREEEKLFYIIVKNVETNVFRIHATNEQNALLVAIDFLSENDLVKIDEKNKFTSIFATGDKNAMEKIVKDLEEKNADEIYEKYNRIPCEISLVTEDYIEEYENDIDEDENFAEDFDEEDIEESSDFLGDIKIYFEINNSKGRKIKWTH